MLQEPNSDHKFIFDLENKNGDYFINSESLAQKNSELEGLGENAVWLVVKSLKLVNANTNSNNNKVKIMN